LELIHEQDGREYWLQVLGATADFQPPFAGAPYPVLLWDTAGDRSLEDLATLAAALIDSGVRNAVCGGRECERWHDALDTAFLAQGLSGEEYESRFVMTSWHTDESPDDVAFFFVWNTNFDDHDFRRFLVVQLGANWEVTQDLRRAVVEQSQGSEDDEEPEETWDANAV
jgi:hypothetical protein